MNQKVEHIDIFIEREKLVKLNEELKVENDAYSLLFRALHELSSSNMNLI